MSIEPPVPSSSETMYANEAETEASFLLPRTISVEGITSDILQQVYKKARVDSPSFLLSKPQPSPFHLKNYTNLLSEKTSSVLFATDEWFARAENLIKDSEPVFISDLYCPEGMLRYVTLCLKNAFRNEVYCCSYPCTHV